MSEKEQVVIEGLKGLVLACSEGGIFAAWERLHKNFPPAPPICLCETHLKEKYGCPKHGGLTK